MPSPSVYLDWNATTSPLPAVLDAMREAAESGWGNPASTHRHGSRARSFVEKARSQVADLAGVDVRDVLFTSGGTEANNMALVSSVAMASGRGTLPRIVTSRLEHPSVAKTSEALAREGRASVRWLRVLETGSIDLGDLEAALGEGPAAVVAVQAVNHETGVIQPVGEVLRLAREHGAPVHVDTVQCFGKLDETWLEATSRVLAGHKIQGPKGIGALITRPGTVLRGLLQGGSQERGLRPGTIDPVACAGLAVAAQEAARSHETYALLSTLRDRLERGILERAPFAKVAGAGAVRAPHVTNVVFPGLSGPELVAALDVEGVSVSAGSACSAGTVDPSPVLDAMFGAGLAASGVRFSLGPRTTDADIAVALDVVETVVRRFSA